jgi:hypothetical protein
VKPSVTLKFRACTRSTTSTGSSGAVRHRTGPTG